MNQVILDLIFVENHHQNISLMEKLQGWQLYAIILDKLEFIKAVGTDVDRGRLYSVLAHEVLKDINFSRSKTVSLLIDKSQNEKGIHDFNNYLRASLNLLLPLNCALNITHETSQQGLGIQAVDMFCYGFFRKHEYNDLAWYNLFRRFIFSERKYKP